MQAIGAIRHMSGGVAQHRRATWRPSAVPRRPRAPPRSAAVVLTAAAPGAGASCFELMAAAGKITKTAVGKLTVGELRQECERLQIPTDGLKPALVERLLEWWAQQQQEEPEEQQDVGAQGSQQQAGISTTSSSGSAPAQEARLSVPAQTVQHAPPTPSAAPMAAAAAAPSASSSSIGSDDAPQQERQLGSRQGGQVSVTWLGTSSGNPTPRRNVSAIAVRFDDDLYLVDCGEGTRNQLRKGRVDVGSIKRLFVTHMHGDHCFGIGGLLSAVCEARLGTPEQNDTFYIYGPPEVQSLVMAAIRMGSVHLTTPVVVTGFVLDPRRARPPTVVDAEGMLQMALQGPDQGDKVPPQLAQGWQAAYDQGSDEIVQRGLTWSVRIPGGPLVAAAQLQHRVPCWGYVFQEAPQLVPRPSADSRRQQQQRQPAAAAAAAEAEGAAGLDAESQQEVPAAGAAAAGDAPAQEEPWVRRGRRLVILGDTCNSSAIAPLALSCDLLSHEATFCSGMEDKAAIAQHSTTEQAGAFAASVDARALVLTHFSARYESLTGIATQMQRRVHSNGGPHRTRTQSAAAAVAGDMKSSEMMRLLDETRSTYQKDTIYLAHDFYTHHVPPPAAVPAEQAQQAAAYQAQLRAAASQKQQSQSQVRSPRPQQYQQQQQQGGWQQRSGGRPQQQRARPSHSR